jgi:serine/threonine protein kinase
MTKTGQRVCIPLRELEARHSISGITEALIHLHGLGIAHGDIRP